MSNCAYFSQTNQHPKLYRAAVAASVGVAAFAVMPEKVKRFAVSFFSDVLLLIPALGATTYAKVIGSNFDPKNPPSDKTPILMIHGNGFNEMQWLYGRYVLQKEKCGPVFTLNLDGLLTNKYEHGIISYADMVQKKMKEIRDLTKNKKVITISTPWGASIPLLQFMSRFLPFLFKHPQRYKDMSDENLYITELKSKISLEKFRTIYSTADGMVPGELGSLGLDAKNTSRYRWLGHYSPMIIPSVWTQVAKWVNENGS